MVGTSKAANFIHFFSDLGISPMSHGSGIFKKSLCGLGRGFLGIGVPALLLLLAALPYIAYQLDGHVRTVVQKRLSERFPHAHIKVGEARFISGRGIRIRDVSIRKAGQLGDRALLATIDEVWLLTKQELAELALGEVAWGRIALVRPTLFVKQTSPGVWNMASLLPEGDSNAPPLPEWQVVDGAVELVDVMSVGDRAKILLRGVQAMGKTTRTSSGKQEHRIQARFHGDDLESAHVKIFTRPSDSVWNVQGEWRELRWRTAWLNWLPQQARVWLINSELEMGVNGKISAQRIGVNKPWTWQATGDWHDGVFDDVRLPLPLAGLRGEFDASSEGLALKHCSARHGRTTLYFDWTQSRWDERRTCHFEAVARDFECHHDLYRYLPSDFPALRSWWTKLTPDGEAHIRVSGAYQEGVWKPALDVEFVDAAITYDGFPYRVRNAKGHISYQDERLTSDVTAYAGSRPLRFQMDVSRPGKQAIGFIGIEGEQISIDGKVLEALPKLVNRQVQHLRPRGAFNLRYRWSKDDPNQETADREMLLTFVDCQLNHESFPYPLNNVQGEVLQRNNVWSFGPTRPLEGTGGDGQVQCQGSLATAQDGAAPHLDLFFTGRSIPLNGALRDALDIRGQTLWNDLRPQGKIHFTAHVRHDLSEKRPIVRVQLAPDGDTVSVQPVHFPYRMDHIQGEIEVEQNTVSWKQMRASHEGTTLATGGRLTCDNSSPWHLELSDLHIDWHDQDQDLVEALPIGLRKVFATVSPRGRFHVSGDLSLQQAEVHSEPQLAAAHSPLAQWNLRIDCVNGSLSCGAPLTNIHGAVRDLIGESRDGAVFTRGELECDSVTVLGHPITGIRGPLRITPSGMTLGAGASLGPESVHHRNLVGSAYGGTLVASGELPWASHGNYALRATLADADLSQFAREYLPGHQRLAGRVDATAHILGNRTSRQSLRGGGAIQLRDADIYELPIMVSMLKLLSLSRATPTAFNEGHIEYRIMGDYLELPRIDFLGDVFSLKGKGQVKFSKELDLLFAARLGRREIPLVSRISESAAERLMPVRVTGTLLDPETTIGSLAALNDTSSTATPPSKSGRSSLGRLTQLRGGGNQE